MLDLMQISDIYYKAIDPRKVMEFVLNQPSDFSLLTKRVKIRWHASAGTYTPVDPENQLLLAAMHHSGMRTVSVDVEDSVQIAKMEDAPPAEDQEVFFPRNNPLRAFRDRDLLEERRRFRDLAGELGIPEVPRGPIMPIDAENWLEEEEA